MKFPEEYRADVSSACRKKRLKMLVTGVAPDRHEFQAKYFLFSRQISDLKLRLVGETYCRIIKKNRVPYQKGALKSTLLERCHP